MHIENLDKTLHKLFETQVRNTPEKTALVYSSSQLTYKELNELANCLAHYLQIKHGIHDGAVIALCMKRSQYMIVAVLAILKAGAVYVPVDFDYPDERICHILNDTQAKIILTSEACQTRLIPLLNNFVMDYVSTIAIDHDEFYTEMRNANLIDNPPSNTSSTSLAYIMYTSGTSGVAKGVMINHSTILAKLSYLLVNHQINSSYNILAKTPCVFDPSLREIFLALLSGAKLVIADEEDIQDIQKLLQLCISAQIHLAVFVPSHLRLFVDMLANAGEYKLLQLRLLYSCGEPLPGELAQRILNYIPAICIKNQYGPTEMCMFSCEYTIRAVKDIVLPQIPIGKPIDKVQIYILNAELAEVKPGEIGELYIAGNNSNYGYLNLPALTAASFITSSLVRKIDTTYLYKSGDLVKVLADGNLAFIARSDNQIKLHGVRVEPGEIEMLLNQYPGVKTAVVLCKSHMENKYLIAYYIATKALDEQQIYLYLARYLPRYMLPAQLICLDALPLTRNGKLDRRALAAGSSIDMSANELEPPHNELEFKVREVFAAVLGLKPEQVGINADFFKLGGNSILAARLVGLLKAEGVNYTVFDLYLKRSISALLEPINPRLKIFSQYYQFADSMSTSDTIFIMAPGLGCDFAPYYVELAQSLYDAGCNAQMFMLKSNFTTLDDLDKIAAYYVEITHKFMPCRTTRIVFFGYSAGGVIAYAIAGLLEKHYSLKLVLFDTIFNRSSNYYGLRSYLRAKLKLAPLKLPWLRLKINKVPLLYFRANYPKRKVLGPALKLRWLRKLKYEIEGLLSRSSDFYQRPNGLKLRMKIKRVIRIDAEHNGVNGMLNKVYIPQIAAQVLKWISS